MKKLAINSIYFTILLVVVLFSCTNNSSNNNEQGEIQTAIKDVSELTYADVISVVFNDEGEGIEWHGEPMPNEFADQLTMSYGDSCGEKDCGKQVFITNSNESQTIEIIVKGAYDIEGDIGYISRKYSVVSGQKLSMGCTHLCYNGKSYIFDREIVGSKIAE